MKSLIRILEIAKEKRLKKFDSVFVVCGMEGSGKSTLMLHGMDYLGAEPWQIALDRVNFVKAIWKTKKQEQACLDEAGDALFSRDALSDFNKDLVKTYMVIRGKGLITFLVIPDFFLLDRYFREHRVRGLFYTYRRGKFLFYTRKEIKKIISSGDRFIPMKPLYKSDSFPDYTGRLLQPYLEMKDKKIDCTLNELNEKYSSGKPNLASNQQMIITLYNKGNKQAEIARVLKLSTAYVCEFLKKTKKSLTN